MNLKCCWCRVPASRQPKSPRAYVGSNKRTARAPVVNSISFCGTRALQSTPLGRDDSFPDEPVMSSLIVLLMPRLRDRPEPGGEREAWNGRGLETKRKATSGNACLVATFGQSHDVRRTVPLPTSNTNGASAGNGQKQEKVINCVTCSPFVSLRNVSTFG
jgi:hypothetical protein